MTYIQEDQVTDTGGGVRFSVGEFSTPRLTFAEDLAVYREAGAEGIGIDPETISAMTITLTKGCRRLTGERGSSSDSKCLTTSSKPIWRTSAIIHSPGANPGEAHGEGYTKKAFRR